MLALCSTVSLELQITLWLIDGPADELCAVAQEVKAQPRHIHLGEKQRNGRLSGSIPAENWRSIGWCISPHTAFSRAALWHPRAGIDPDATRRGNREDDRYLSASEIATLKLYADWVILSACNAAAGAATSAEALSGLRGPLSTHRREPCWSHTGKSTRMPPSSWSLSLSARWPATQGRPIRGPPPFDAGAHRTRPNRMRHILPTGPVRCRRLRRHRSSGDDDWYDSHEHEKGPNRYKKSETRAVSTGRLAS